MENLQLIVKNDDGQLVLADFVEKMLLALKQRFNDYCEDRKTIEDAIKDAMLANHLKTTTIGNFKCSVREYKDEWSFNADEFKQHESPELVKAFTKTDVERNTYFDVERFKEEQPEMYKKYLVTKETAIETIDSDKLWKVLNDVWSKYAVKTPAKPATISIKEV